jgi:hypothetical protein
MATQATDRKRHCGTVQEGREERRPCVLLAGHQGAHVDCFGYAWERPILDPPDLFAQDRLYYGVVSPREASHLARITGVYRLPMTTLVVVTPEGLHNILGEDEAGQAHFLGARMEVSFRGAMLCLWPLRS